MAKIAPKAPAGGTHPATAAIAYAFAAFILTFPLAAVGVALVARDPGLGAGLAVIALQLAFAACAGAWGARRHRRGRAW